MNTIERPRKQRIKGIVSTFGHRRESSKPAIRKKLLYGISTAIRKKLRYLTISTAVLYSRFLVSANLAARSRAGAGRAGCP